MGETGDYSTALQDFYEYDPTADVWSARADMVFPITNSAWSVGFSLGNDVYIGTGVLFPVLLTQTGSLNFLSELLLLMMRLQMILKFILILLKIIYLYSLQIVRV